MYKFALIHYGTHEIYGLCFVASEIRRCGHEFRWFDGESEGVVDEIALWEPDFVCLSPLSAFFDSIIKLTAKIKHRLPGIRSVFGGLHVLAVPEIINLDEVDIAVTGPVYGTIDEIINSKTSRMIKGNPISPENIIPAKREYYEQIPRIGERHIKMIMSKFGCIQNCSYCSTSNIREVFGTGNYKTHWLTRRSLENVMNEARLFLDYPTTEVELSDDDMLQGADIDTWLPAFASAWKSEIKLSLFGNVTPFSVLKVSDETLNALSGLVTNVCIGLQAVEDETLKLFNRQSQTKDLFTRAIERLNAFDIAAKVDIIVGNPVKDPVEDAIETIKFAQSLCSNNVIATIYPLMLYPGTSLTKWCLENNVPLNDECLFNFYAGVGSIKFDSETSKKIRCLVKLGHFFIAHKIPERWIRALIETDINETAARDIANCNYHDSLVYHGKSEKEIEKIMQKVKLYC